LEPGMKPTHCAACGTPIVHGFRSRRIYCPPCSLQQMYGHRQRVDKTCAYCGETFAARNDPRHRFCSRACQSLGQSRERGHLPRQRRPSWRASSHALGSYRHVGYASCLFCRRLLTVTRQDWLCDQHECRIRMKRTYMRSYFRSNRKTATKYWRIADTPEAIDLAETYFDLRLELRPNGKHKQEWRRYRAAQHERHQRHAMGTGTGTKGRQDDPGKR
jgi:hypothetical protein